VAQATSPLRMTRVPSTALIVVAALVVRLPSLFRQLFDPDEGAIATMAMVVSRGGVLYRDVIDRKPPGAPLLYSLSFWVTGARDLRPVHFIAALELAACALILMNEARRSGTRRAGWWAAGLFLAGAVAFMPSDAQPANFSQLALLPACAAIVAVRRNSARSATWAGVFLGIAILTRQSWLIGIAPAAYAAWLHGGRRLSRAAMVVGATVATIGAVALIVPFGAFFQWTFTANGSLLSDMTHSGQIIPRALFSALLFLSGHIVVCWLAARRGWHREDLDLWLWVATGVISVAVGFRFFSHYWFQVLPPLCLLAAPAVESYTKLARRVLAGVAIVTTAAFWGLAWMPQHHADPTALVAAVRAGSSPQDRIAVWGSFPEVYWLSGRLPGGAFVLSDFLVGRNGALDDRVPRGHTPTPGALETFLKTMRANPPRLFLDTSTGHVRDYQYFPMSSVPQVAAFVRHHYQRVGVARGVTVYRLTRRAAAAAVDAR
jgi:hypothetical protein